MSIAASQASRTSSATRRRSASMRARKAFVTDDELEGPESSAVRVALWRAMHVRIDAPPHVIEDEIGLQLLSPDEG